MSPSESRTTSRLSQRVAHVAERFRVDRIRDSSLGAKLYGHAYWIYKSRIEARDAIGLMPFVPAGSTVIDVGANLGFFTRLFIERSSCARVLAVEPEARNLVALRGGAARWGRGRVEVIDAAVAELTGTVNLHVDPHNHADHQLAAEGVVVRAIRLDDLVAERGGPQVGMIKIDVQGAEARVLAGASDLLARQRPAIFIELDPERLAKHGATPTDVLSQLTTAGYGFALVSAAGATPRHRDDIIQQLTGDGYLDVLCRPTGPPAC
jgi:FkbM family methyltransferase